MQAMTDPKKTLTQLKKSLNILRAREAKYGRSVPPELLSQIEDHEIASSQAGEHRSGKQQLRVSLYFFRKARPDH